MIFNILSKYMVLFLLFRHAFVVFNNFLVNFYGANIQRTVLIHIIFL